MANQWYPLALQELTRGNLDFLSQTMRLAIVKNYTYNSSHQFVSDVVAAGGNIGATATLTTKTASLGKLDSDDAALGAVAADAAHSKVILYEWTGSNATSRLWACWDTATGLPVTPNGSAINILTNDATNGITKFG